MDISKKLVETHSLSKKECLELFSLFDVPERFAKNTMERRYLQEGWLNLQIIAKIIVIIVESEEIIEI